MCGKTSCSHATHTLQPLDADCFRTFKSVWRDTINECSTAHNAESLPRHCRTEVIGNALLESLSFMGILNSWKHTGLWPINCERALQAAKITCTSETKQQSKYSMFVVIRQLIILTSGVNSIYKTKASTSPHPEHT